MAVQRAFSLVVSLKTFFALPSSQTVFLNRAHKCTCPSAAGRPAAGRLKLKDMSRKKKKESVARGYRLKPETHRLIRLVKENLGISHDKIINDALKLYYIELRKSHKIT